MYTLVYCTDISSTLHTEWPDQIDATATTTQFLEHYKCNESPFYRSMLYQLLVFARDARFTHNRLTQTLLILEFVLLKCLSRRSRCTSLTLFWRSLYSSYSTTSIVLVKRGPTRISTDVVAQHNMRNQVHWGAHSHWSLCSSVQAYGDAVATSSNAERLSRYRGSTDHQINQVTCLASLCIYCSFCSRAPTRTHVPLLSGEHPTWGCHSSIITLNRRTRITIEW